MTNIKNALSRKKQQSHQFDFLFRVDLPDISVSGADIKSSSRSSSVFDPFASIMDTGNSVGEMLSQDANDISHRVWRVDAPLTTYDSEKSTDKDTFWYRAGGSDIGNLTLVIDEMEDGATLNYLLEWQKLIDNGGKGFRNPPIVYKRNIRVIQLSPTKSDSHVHLYKGYFPTEISPINFSNESNGVLQYSVQFSGDSVEHEIVSNGVNDNNALASIDTPRTGTTPSSVDPNNRNVLNIPEITASVLNLL